MHRKTLKHPLIWVLFLLVYQPVSAENWPGWRGPRGDGTSSEQHLPKNWSATENVAWKIPLPGTGHASPIVWGERVFILSAVPESTERLLICLNRNSGETIWKRTVMKARLEKIHRLNSYASSTPVTDGHLIYVTFFEAEDREVVAPNVGSSRLIYPGKMVVAAYDFNGSQKWVSKPGEFISAHGFSSSPVLYKNLVIVNGDHDGNSYLVALDQNNGDIVWKVPRENHTRSYCTPIIREIEGRTQMLLSGSLSVASYDPGNGSQHWKIEGPTEQFVASLVYSHELVFVTAGYPEHHILAIRPDGSGNVTDTHIQWRNTRGASYVPSPVILDNYFLIVSDAGIASCFDAKTGSRHWMKRMGRRYSASLVTAGKWVYFLSDYGITTVIKPGKTYDEIAINALEEHCFASPAISQGQLFVRGEQNLYCIGTRHQTSVDTCDTDALESKP